MTKGIAWCKRVWTVLSITLLYRDRSPYFSTPCFDKLLLRLSSKWNAARYAKLGEIRIILDYHADIATPSIAIVKRIHYESTIFIIEPMGKIHYSPVGEGKKILDESQTESKQFWKSC